MNYNNYDNQYSTTSYGAQGGAGGGGFMERAGSQTSPNANKTRAQESLRPLTIKQLLEAEQGSGEDSFSVDGEDINQITFVAQIRSIFSQRTDTTYKLDDGTGTIEARSWVELDDEMKADGATGASKLAEQDYVRVYGRLKAPHGKRNVRASIIRAVPDLNEVQYHLLHATAVHLELTRGPPGGSKGEATSNGHATNGGQEGPLLKSGSTEARVYDLIKNSEQSNEGLNVHDIAAQLKLSYDAVRAAGEILMSGGQIYSTVDEETWAPLLME